jgi:hypothetical protein
MLDHARPINVNICETFSSYYVCVANIGSLIQYTHSIIQDDWIIVDNGIVAPANTTNVDPVPLEDEIDIKNEISVMISLQINISIDVCGSGVSIVREWILYFSNQFSTRRANISNSYRDTIGI